MNASFLSRSMLRAALAAAVLATASVATADEFPDVVVGGPEDVASASGFYLAPGAGVPVGPVSMPPSQMVGPSCVNPMPPSQWVDPSCINPMSPSQWVDPSCINPMNPSQMVIPNGMPMQQPYRLGFRGTNTGWGVKIASIARGGTAAQLGLEPGDVILAVNGQRVFSVNDYHAVMAQSGGTVQLTVLDSQSGTTVQTPAFTLNQPASVACAQMGW